MSATEKQIAYATLIANELGYEKPNFDSFEDTQLFLRTYASEFRNKDRVKKGTQLVSVFIPERMMGYLQDTSEYHQKIADVSLEGRHGVYTFWSDKELVYVGKSQNLRQRMHSSFNERNFKPKVITHVRYYKTNSYADTHVLETILIAKHKPTLNKQFNVYDSITFKIDGVPSFEDFETIQVYTDETIKELMDG